VSLFATSGDAYDRFMGRYSVRLAPAFADFAGVEAGLRVLDVGCGPGALTEELARRVGAERVVAADPAEQFVEACRGRVPGADVRVAPAEALPFEDAGFDVALAQLVLSFLRDADAGAAQMRRVVREGGTVAACSWAAGDGMEMLQVFWDAAGARVEPGAQDAENRMRYRTREELAELASGAGLQDVEIERLPVEASYEDFEDFWAPVTSAPGPVGAFYARLDDDQRSQVRDECRRRLGDPAGPFTLAAAAWAVRGRV